MHRIRCLDPKSSNPVSKPEDRRNDAYDNYLKEGETPKKGQDVGGYNTAWMDPGTKLLKVGDEYRSSIIISPKIENLIKRT